MLGVNVSVQVLAGVKLVIVSEVDDVTLGQPLYRYHGDGRFGAAGVGAGGADAGVCA